MKRLLTFLFLVASFAAIAAPTNNPSAGTTSVSVTNSPTDNYVPVATGDRAKWSLINSNNLDAGTLALFSGGGAAQTPWSSDINGNNHKLTNALSASFSTNTAGVTDTGVFYSNPGLGGTFANFAAGAPSLTFSGSADHSTLIGGGNQTVGVNSDYCGVFQGQFNSIGNQWSHSIILGGYGNQIENQAAIPLSTAAVIILGGVGNTAKTNSYRATILGGGSNSVAGNYSLAAGLNAKATNNGTFVWADAQGPAFGSAISNSLSVRAQNGMGVNTNSAGTNALRVNGSVDIIGNANAQSFSIDGVPLVGGSNSAASYTIGYGLSASSGALEVLGSGENGPPGTAFQVDEDVLTPTDIDTFGSGEYEEAGLRFIPSRTLTVTSLGRWLSSDNTNDHTLTLYGPGTNRLASVTFTAGTNHPGGFAYFPITPTNLTAGVTYTVASSEVMLADTVPWLNGSTEDVVFLNLGITNIGDALRTNGQAAFDSLGGGFALNFKVDVPVMNYFNVSNLVVERSADIPLAGQHDVSLRCPDAFIVTGANNSIGMGTFRMFTIDSASLDAAGVFTFSSFSVSGQRDGTRFGILNQSGHQMTIANHGTGPWSSYAGFETYKGASIIMTNGLIEFRYDASSNRWAVVSKWP